MKEQADDDHDVADDYDGDDLQPSAKCSSPLFHLCLPAFLHLIQAPFSRQFSSFPFFKFTDPKGPGK